MDGGLLSQLALLGLAAFLVVLNGFFVAAEFAIVKVRATRIEELFREGNRRARMARHLIHHLDAYLSATQVGVTIASLGLGWIGEPALAYLLAPALVQVGISSAGAHGIAFVVAFSIISAFHIVLGELAPKSLAIQRAESTALWVAFPLRIFYVVMWPAIAVLNWASNRVLGWLGLHRATEADLAHSSEELRMIVEASGASGELNPQEKKLLDNALQFSERLVREIMVPRTDMVCLYTRRSLDENLAIVRDAQHTRYPLAVEEKDHIIGMIHVRDLIQAQQRAEDGGEPLSLERLKRPVLFVPAVATIDRVLRLFQRGRSHLAIVVDEYGGIAGLVTLEDVLEELVGEIRDEFDVDETDRRVEPGAGGEVLVDASMSLDEVARALRFEPAQATVDTIGGYVLQVLGRLPKEGETVRMGRYQVEVAEMDGLRVTRLRFKPAEGKGARAAVGPDQGAGAPPPPPGGEAP
jgi:CBS domain containing-hemolysin-like protein